MPGRQSLYVMMIHGGIAVAVVFAATLLAYHGSIDAQTVSVVFGAALGLAGATATSLATLGQVVNGKSVLTSQQVAEQGATQRTAIVAAAAGDAHTVEPQTPNPTPREG